MSECKICGSNCDQFDTLPTPIRCAGVEITPEAAATIAKLPKIDFSGSSTVGVSVDELLSAAEEVHQSLYSSRGGLRTAVSSHYSSHYVLFFCIYLFRGCDACVPSPFGTLIVPLRMAYSAPSGDYLRTERGDGDYTLRDGSYRASSRSGLPEQLFCTPEGCRGAMDSDEAGRGDDAHAADGVPPTRYLPLDTSL